MDNDTRITKINNNDLIIGPSGAGKTRGYVKPNILQMNESMVIADTKGNLHEEFHILLKKNGYKVMLIDYKNMDNSYGYNPLDCIRYDKKRKQYVAQDILTVARIIAPVSENARDPFWDLAANLYLSCIIAYVLECLEPTKHTMENIAKRIPSLTSTEFSEEMESLSLENPNSFAFRQYQLIKSNADTDRMHASIVGIAIEKFSTLIFDEALEMYHKEERIDFESIANEKTAFFLTISDTDRSMDKLSTLFYAQALQNLCAYADNSPDNRLPVPVRFILDDFATNTVIPNFDNIISVIRSREISVSIIIQSITQLYSVYDINKAKTIINNCDNCLYLGGQDIDTAEFISRKANVQINEVLDMEISSAYLFTRGKKGQKVTRFDIDDHPSFDELKNSQTLVQIVDNIFFNKKYSNEDWENIQREIDYFDETDDLPF